MDDIVNNIITGIYLLGVVGPIVVSAGKFFGAKTHNQRIINLSKRADIIVGSLVRAQIPGVDKKKIAMDSLSKYAKGTRIKLTPDQASEYIENAVAAYKGIAKVIESVTDDAEPPTTK